MKILIDVKYSCLGITTFFNYSPLFVDDLAR